MNDNETKEPVINEKVSKAMYYSAHAIGLICFITTVSVLASVLLPLLVQTLGK